MEREYSAGGVVVRWVGGRWMMAAIRPAGKGRRPAVRGERAARGVLALPKGLVDRGEHPELPAQSPRRRCGTHRRHVRRSNLVFTAWDGEKLVGILRGWTDGTFDGYICDLAVDPDYQKAGIGRELLDRCLATGRQVQFVLRASRIAERYYQHLGWQKIESGWFVPREPWQ